MTPRVRDYIIIAPPVPSIASIKAAVAEHYKITPIHLYSARQARSLAHPRQVAMYLACKLTPQSMGQIGRRFERDHTTVLHAVKAVERRMVSDPEVAADVAALRQRIGA